jgi:hypothetical protein
MRLDSKDDFKATTTTDSSPSPPLEDGHNLTRDDARLEDLGYKQELKRNFSRWETFGGECENNAIASGK